MQQLDPAPAQVLRRGGVFVPSPLALDQAHKPDWRYQRLLTHYYLDAGAVAVVPGAHTGEFANQDPDLLDEWLQVVREVYDARDETAPRLLMAAVGGQEAKRQAELAANRGYDLAMLAPTAFTGQSDQQVVSLVEQISEIIPVFGFELQRAIPGSHPFSASLWRSLFRILCGAKGASFNTYRSLVMLEAAATSGRQHELTLLTGNDDRIVADLSGVYRFRTAQGEVAAVRYAGGLLGHLATDTRAAVDWVSQARASSAGAPGRSHSRCPSWRTRSTTATWCSLTRSTNSATRCGV